MQLRTRFVEAQGSLAQVMDDADRRIELGDVQRVASELEHLTLQILGPPLRLALIHSATIAHVADGHERGESSIAGLAMPIRGSGTL